jgi:hypothetical protein
MANPNVLIPTNIVTTPQCNNAKYTNVLLNWFGDTFATGYGICYSFIAVLCWVIEWAYTQTTTCIVGIQASLIRLLFDEISIFITPRYCADSHMSVNQTIDRPSST